MRRKRSGKPNPAICGHASRKRRRHTANTGHLDVRKTLRKSMAHGGVPFEIEWKVKKVDKPSIVAICDVSKSVAAAAQFLLTFLYSLNEVVDRLDAYANTIRKLGNVGTHSFGDLAPASGRGHLSITCAAFAPSGAKIPPCLPRL